MIELRRRYSGGKGSDSPSFSRLPEGYQEVEYLESTGTQYIQTPIVGNDGTDVYVDFQFTKYVQSSCLFGTYIDNPATRWYFFWRNEFEWNFGHGADKNVNVTNPYDRHTVGYITSGPKYVLIDGNAVKYFATTINTELPLRLFWCNNNIEAGKNYPCYAKIFSFKATTETSEYDLIPCYRISDRVAGMYDIVNDVFYTNQGTGEFSYGQDVHYNIPLEYQEVEWLKGDGSAYIKADFIVNSEQEFEITFRIDDFSSIQMLFGISSPYYRLYSHSVGGTNQIEFQYQRNVWNQNIESGEKYTFKKVGQKYYLNDNELPIQLSSNFQSTQDFYIFSCNGEIGMYESKNYIYITKLHDRQLIPCYRRSDDVAGMYDLVSGEFYTNAGTGEFIVGPDIIS